MYFNGFFNMEELSSEVDYAVFDDLVGGFEFFKTYKAWLGAQEEFTVTDKYRRKKKFMWGKPVVMCMNEDPRGSAHIDLDWFDANCFSVYIGDPLVEITVPSNSSHPEE